MARTSPEKRRIIRAKEAKRDALLTKQNTNKVELKKVRAELKELRKQ